MHTPGKVGSLGAQRRLVLLHEPETVRRLAMGHRLVRSALIAWMVRGQGASIAAHAPELGGPGSLITARGPTSETRIKGSSTTIQHYTIRELRVKESKKEGNAGRLTEFPP